ncbi:hypothetical protein [Tessaracoccus antarcticus]|uniref:ECF transporter S component n=1 Tax=Tessaracoccus antarcticus TaxID=2479848 RepID=A0A3M0G031_9ACTN|nr:hypothetical protein [Tessaracoccus antarcticus]RMB58341.1 hypothetical protein EAX62_14170 [Tessaracoccus antarcticus]
MTRLLAAWRSRSALLTLGVLGVGWLAWPIWSSFTAPGRDALQAETPFLLAALLSLLAVLATSIWLDAGRRASVFGPVLLVALVDALVRMLLSPGGSGIEPVYALPLLAGAALGAPAGFLTGALAALASSVAMGLVDTPLVGQILVWGMWGAVGGFLRLLRPVVAWMVAVLACLPLGVLTGMALNITGWTGERDATTGGFLPGLPPLEALQRLVDYTLATSVAFDLTRAAVNALVILAVGLPVLRALRHTHGAPAPVPPASATPPPDVAPAALSRRHRSDTLTTLWNTPTTQEIE